MKLFETSATTLCFAVLLAASLLGVASRPALAESGFTGMQIQGMSQKIAQALGRDNTDGILVRDVALGGPANKAGIERGDLILEYAGQKITSFKQMIGIAQGTKAGQKVTVAAIRDGKPLSLTMTLGAWAPAWRVTNTDVGAIAPLGLTMATLTPKMRKGLDLRWSSHGVVVTLVDEKIEFMELVRGDLIIQVNQQQVWQPKQVVDLYSAAKKAKQRNLLLLVERVNGFQYMSLPVK